jgi:hypothetical protein
MAISRALAAAHCVASYLAFLQGSLTDPTGKITTDAEIAT